MKSKHTILKTTLATIAIVLSSLLSGTTTLLAAPVTETYSAIWRFHAGEGVDSMWMNVNYNDKDWKKVRSDVLLKDQNVKLDNSFGWYRKDVKFSKKLRKEITESGAIILNLGKLAACDEVYFNGKLVGKTGRFPHDFMGYFDNERKYLVTADNINLDGENIIAIKFHDGWGVGGFLNGAMLSISSADTDDKLVLNVAVGDSDYIFLGADPIQITPSIQNKNASDVEGQLLVTLTTDDFQPIKADSKRITIPANGVYSDQFEFVNPTPGFYRYTVQLKRNNEVVCEKKFNVGYEPEKIVSPIDAQPDFKEFWDNNLAELAKVAPDYKLTLQPEYSKLGYNVYLVEMRSLDNELIRGYYAQPKAEGKHPIIVEYMGYGSKPYPPTQWWDGFAYFILSVRGQALNEPTNRFGTWITSGLDDKQNYYYRGAFMDVVRALDFVCSRPEIDSDKIAARGGSQGGALTIAAASLDKRVKVVAPSIPFLSDYPDYFKIAPWPKSDFDYYMTQHPEASWDDVYKTLSYFDVKNLAQWVDCPYYMGIGVQDNVCPPHTNFAGYNQVKSEKNWIAFPEFGHSVGREYHENMMDFFREKLNVAKP